MFSHWYMLTECMDIVTWGGVSLWCMFRESMGIVTEGVLTESMGIVSEGVLTESMGIVTGGVDRIHGYCEWGGVDRIHGYCDWGGVDRIHGYCEWGGVDRIHGYCDWGGVDRIHGYCDWGGVDRIHGYCDWGGVDRIPGYCDRGCWQNPWVLWLRADLTVLCVDRIHGYCDWGLIWLCCVLTESLGIVTGGVDRIHGYCDWGLIWLCCVLTESMEMEAEAEAEGKALLDVYVTVRSDAGYVGTCSVPSPCPPPPPPPPAPTNVCMHPAPLSLLPSTHWTQDVVNQCLEFAFLYMEQDWVSATWLLTYKEHMLRVFFSNNSKCTSTSITHSHTPLTYVLTKSDSVYLLVCAHDQVWQCVVAGLCSWPSLTACSCWSVLMTKSGSV